MLKLFCYQSKLFKNAFFHQLVKIEFLPILIRLSIFELLYFGVKFILWQKKIKCRHSIPHDFFMYLWLVNWFWIIQNLTTSLDDRSINYHAMIDPIFSFSNKLYIVNSKNCIFQTHSKTEKIYFFLESHLWRFFLLGCKLGWLGYSWIFFFRILRF